MNECLVMTIIGPDRPGLVSDLAKTVSNHNGNWLESKLALLSGQFAGVVRIECSSTDSEKIITALQSASLHDLKIEIARERTPESKASQIISIELIANDRSGIISELTDTISRAGGNIEELESCIENAAHAGHPLFKAEGRISLPEEESSAEFIESLEELSPDLQVSIL